MGCCAKVVLAQCTKLAAKLYTLKPSMIDNFVCSGIAEQISNTAVLRSKAVGLFRPLVERTNN
jgi:hypothetical protein